MENGIETELGQSVYILVKWSLFSGLGSPVLLGQITGNWLMLLNMATMDSQEDAGLLSKSDCHSSEHNSVFLVF